MSGTRAGPCGTHAERAAGWWCPRCDRALCSGCAAQGALDVPVCAGCGHGVETLYVRRAEAFPWARHWQDALAWLAASHAAVHLLVVAAVLQVLFSLGPGAWLVGRLLEAAWVVLIARRASENLDPFGPPAFTFLDLGAALTGPVRRWMAGAGLPLLGVAWVSALGQRAVPWTSAVAWGCAVLAVLALPPALVVAGLDAVERPVAWPWKLWGWAARLGGDLWPLHALAAAAVGLEWVGGALPALSAEDVQLELSMGRALVLRIPSVVALGALGCLAGRLTWTRASDLGHAPEADRVPRVREVPSGRFVPPERDPAEVEAERARRYAPLELDEDVRPDEGPVERAQRLAARGDHSGAAGMLWALVSGPGGEDTARALVVLARLHVERLDLPDLGWTLYQRAVTEYPGTSAADFARARLAEAGKGG